MNRTDIEQRVAVALDDPKAAKVAVDTAFDAIAQALVEGDRVLIPGVAVLRAKTIPSRMVRNPATGAKVRAKKTGRVVVTTSMAMKDAIAKGRLPKTSKKAGSTKTEVVSARATAKPAGKKPVKTVTQKSTKATRKQSA